MTPNPLVVELVQRYEAAILAGQQVDLEDLCAEHTELLDAVRTRLERLHRIDSLLLLNDDSSRDDTLTKSESIKRSPTIAYPRIPGHVIRGVIAEGGMGVVYRATNPTLNRDTAVKVIKQRGATRIRGQQRFLTEMRVLAKLDHPNIVRVLHADVAEGLPYFVMPLVSGGTLLGHLSQLLTDPVRSVRLMIAVARAVDFAHSRGVLHRDLKPANILLDENGEPLVSDFGLAKVLEESLAEDESDVEFQPPTDLPNATVSGAVLGTVPYMAPEQVDGRIRDIDPRTDVWALGVILFQLLTGTKPFEGRPESVIEQIRRTSPDRGRLSAAGIDQTLGNVVMLCLRRERADRYQSAGELARDLEAWLTGSRTTRAAESWSRRAKRWGKRVSIPVAFLGLAALMLVIVPSDGSRPNPRDEQPQVSEFESKYERMSAQAIEQLGKREIVSLLGNDGSPAYRIRFGEGKLNPAKNDDVTVTNCSSYGPALIELLPRVPLPEYRIRMRYRFNTVFRRTDARVAIYWAHHSPYPEREDPVDHFFLDFEANRQVYHAKEYPLGPVIPDEQLQDGAVTANLWHFRTTGSELPEDRDSYPIPDPRAFQVLTTSPDAEQYRTLEVHVRPGGVNFFVDNDEVDVMKLTRQRFDGICARHLEPAAPPRRGHLLSRHPDLAGHDLRPSEDGALGVFLIGAAVTIAEFTVEPLDPTLEP